MATKVWTQGLQAGIEQMRESMRKLRVQGLDLMQIHDLVDLRAHWRTLSPWKSEGKIRSAGITTSHEHDELAALLSRYPFDFVQLSYNIKDREVEKRLLGIALDCGIAVLVNRPFQRGELFRKVGNRDSAGWGRRNRLPDPGAVFHEIRGFPPGGDLCDSGDFQEGAYAGHYGG